MTITESDIASLLDDGVIDRPTATRLRGWAAEQREAAGAGVEPAPRRSSFDLANSAYYVGALVIMFALGWFAIEAWQRYGGWPLVGVALAYAALFIVLGETLSRRGWRVPGGLLFTAAVSMAPLLAFAVQAALGLWPESGPDAAPSYYASVNGHTLTITLATVAAALVAIRLRPFAFHGAPLALALLVFAMELGALLFSPAASFAQKEMVTLTVGLLLMGAGYLIDHRTREDYAFWLYLAGLLAFFFPAFSQLRESLAFGLIHLFFMLVAVLIRRRAFMVVGGFGVFSYLVYVAGELFSESLLFPVALSVIGLALIAGGVAYAQREDRIRDWVVRKLPPGTSAALPQNRARATRA